jgi:hypothetical protein
MFATRSQVFTTRPAAKPPAAGLGIFHARVLFNMRFERVGDLRMFPFHGKIQRTDALRVPHTNVDVLEPEQDGEHVHVAALCRGSDGCVALVVVVFVEPVRVGAGREPALHGRSVSVPGGRPELDALHAVPCLCGERQQEEKEERSQLHRECLGGGQIGIVFRVIEYK